MREASISKERAEMAEEKANLKRSISLKKLLCIYFAMVLLVAITTLSPQLVFISASLFGFVGVLGVFFIA